MSYTIDLLWDDDASVWVASSKDIPGLVLREILKSHGCQFIRHGKGDHDIWYSPITGTHVTVDGKIKSRHTANEIMKQSGISYRF